MTDLTMMQPPNRRFLTVLVACLSVVAIVLITQLSAVLQVPRMELGDVTITYETEQGSVILNSSDVSISLGNIDLAEEFQNAELEEMSTKLDAIYSAIYGGH